MDHEARELDEIEQGHRSGEKGRLLAIADRMVDDEGEHEIEEYKGGASGQQKDQGIMVGVRGHSTDSVARVVQRQEILMFKMCREVINPFKKSWKTKRERKKLNIVLTEFMARQAEVRRRGTTEWLVSAMAKHQKKLDEEGEWSEDEEGWEPQSAAKHDPVARSYRHGPTERSGHSYREGIAASARPTTAQRVRFMANAVQAPGADTSAMFKVFREQAAAKVELLRMLYDQRLITTDMAAARQAKIFKEMETAGVPHAGLGHRYL